MTLHATVKGYESGTEHKIWGQKMFEIAFAESLRQHRNNNTEHNGGNVSYIRQSQL